MEGKNTFSDVLVMFYLSYWNNVVEGFENLSQGLSHLEVVSSILVQIIQYIYLVNF